MIYRTYVKGIKLTYFIEHTVYIVFVFYYIGALTKDPHEVFDFIVKLIGQAKRRSGVVSMEGLHHCLNRTILFLLSRPTDSIADQMAVLEALHKLTTHR